jgi:hypothetical protein
LSPARRFIRRVYSGTNGSQRVNREVLTRGASQFLRSGLVAQSQRDCVLQPKVARNELPWERYAQESNLNGVVARRRSPMPQPCWGCDSRRLTQGGSFLATLGFEAESLWDSWTVRLALQETEMRLKAKFRCNAACG